MSRQTVAALSRVDNLHGDEDNAQRNRRFDRGAGHLHPAERCPGERQTVCDGERRDGGEQSSGPLHEEHQSEDEQQVIDP